jgi:hypothetical protein
MPVYRVKCNFVRTVSLLVEAPDEQAIYKATEDENFDPDTFSHEKEIEDWDSMDAVEVERKPVEGVEADLKITEDGLGLEEI